MACLVPDLHWFDGLAPASKFGLPGLGFGKLLLLPGPVGLYVYMHGMCITLCECENVLQVMQTCL